MQDLAPYVARCRELLSSGASLEEVIADLREQGLSKVHSIVVLRKGTGKSPEEAKQLVHFSAAWSDARQRDEEFHELLIASLESEDDAGKP